MELKKSVHLYNFDLKALSKIRVGLLKNKLPMCKIISQNLGEVKICEILKGTQLEGDSNLPNDEKVVLLGGLNDGEINRVINVIKRSINGKAPLFAVVTENNYNWTFKELITELCKEREYFDKNGKPMEEEHEGE